MKIEPPLGYGPITPLEKDHRVLLPHAEETPSVFHRLHAMPLSLSEFEPACRDYPIAFVSDATGETFSAVLVLGLQAKQNLFVLTDGMWDRRTYLPAYVRRYPFCMSRLTVDGTLQMKRIVCVDRSALHEDGEAMYDEEGEAVEQWRSLEKLLFDYEQDLSRCESLTKLIVELDLLEPFTMKAEVDGFTMQLEGMHRVSRDALEALTAEDLRRLMAAGAMEKIYSHLLSLDNFRRLLNRRSFFALKPPSDLSELN
ncbi:MAG: SapC family protein [Betaproteobacteria bacterium]